MLELGYSCEKIFHTHRQGARSSTTAQQQRDEAHSTGFCLRRYLCCARSWPESPPAASWHCAGAHSQPCTGCCSSRRMLATRRREWSFTSSQTTTSSASAALSKVQKRSHSKGPSVCCHGSGVCSVWLYHHFTGLCRLYTAPSRVHMLLKISSHVWGSSQEAAKS